jgi:3-oxoacyl-[acyl-carrier protein] reductase
MLKGKIAIVTGSNQGIGKKITECFTNNGAIVYAVDKTESKHESDKVVSCCFDITNTSEIKELLIKIRKEHGRLDILVNNAGIMVDSLIGMVTEEQIIKSFEVNVFAPIFFIQYASKLMIKQKSGSIINMASIMGISGNYAQIVYASTKGAVISMTKSAAKELAAFKIRVNALAPGVIDTNLIKGISEEKMNSIISKIALQRLGTPQDVANAALFLASGQSEYISGQIIGIDGMMSN